MLIFIFRLLLLKPYLQNIIIRLKSINLVKISVQSVPKLSNLKYT